ncbi:MAG: SGNH/GDSL hydrolase family protein [Phycisphaerae bacterium]|nr:SGNH/GDSL hydrolase family protein [Phycisphaerae bacterium]
MICHAGNTRAPLAAAGLVLFLLPGCAALPLPDPNVRYIAFGDSTSRGGDEGYPGRLMERLGEPASSLAVESHGGETSGAGRDRFVELLDQRLYPNARTLLFWEGGADVIQYIREHDPLLLHSPLDADYPYTAELVDQLDRTQAHLEDVVQRAKDAGLEVFIATYYPIREDFAWCKALLLDVILPAQARRANDYIAALNERIRAAAAEGGATLVDVAAAGDELQSDIANYANCNHLSAAGNALVAEAFLVALRGAGD